jgi:hypothetical protein
LIKKFNAFIKSAEGMKVDDVNDITFFENKSLPAFHSVFRRQQQQQQQQQHQQH